MATRQRPADRGAEDAVRIAAQLGRELRETRRSTGLSLRSAGARAGMSASTLGRIERAKNGDLAIDAICRAGRAVGLAASVKLYPSGPRIRDRAQLALLERFESVLAPSLAMRREVPLPITGDRRAWDARITDGVRSASVEGESRIEDAQALQRRIALKQRDDPGAGPVILLVNRTAHNLAVLRVWREALGNQFPLDGAAILRAVRRGIVPSMSGILLL